MTIAGIASRNYIWYHARPLWVDEEMVLLSVRDRRISPCRPCGGTATSASPRQTSAARSGRMPTPIFEIWHEQNEDVCRSDTFRASLAGIRREAVYLGFDSGTPAGFQELVLDNLSRLGTMTMYRGVAENGHVAIFDLRLPPKPWTVVVTGSSGQAIEPVVRPPGCVGVRPATRW